MGVERRYRETHRDTLARLIPLRESISAEVVRQPSEIRPKSSRKSCRGDGGRDFLHHFAGA